MEEILKSLVPLLVGAILGGLLTAYFDHRKSITGEVWSKRFDQYKKLWALSGNLPKWPRDEKLTRAKLHNLNNALKNWYFNDGGLLLSRKSRDRYEVVQEMITENAVMNSDEILNADLYEKIRKAFSHLRSQMTKDLDSRSSRLIK